MQPRGGSRPKRFATGACRARWNRNHGKGAKPHPAEAVPPVPPVPPVALRDERTADLEWLYAQVKADVQRFGTLIDTPSGPKANPSLAEMRRLLVELDRRDAERATVRPVQEEVSDPNDLRAVLRSVG